MEQQAPLNNNNNNNGDSSSHAASVQIPKELLSLPTTVKEAPSDAKRMSYLENLARGREVLRERRERDRRNMDHLNSLIESQQSITPPSVSSTASNTPSSPTPPLSMSRERLESTGQWTNDLPLVLEGGGEEDERPLKRRKFTPLQSNAPSLLYPTVKKALLSIVSYGAAALATGYIAHRLKSGAADAHPVDAPAVFHPHTSIASNAAASSSTPIATPSNGDAFFKRSVNKK